MRRDFWSQRRNLIPIEVLNFQLLSNIERGYSVRLQMSSTDYSIFCEES